MTKSYPYVDLEDFLKRVQHKNVNKKSLESLVKSGAMDRFGDRAVMLESMEAMLAFNRSAQEIPSKQSSLFSGMPQVRKLVLKQVPPATKEEKLQWEKDLLGLYVTSHPLAEFADALQDKVVSTSTLAEFSDSASVCVAGVLIECKVRTTKAGEQMATGRLQDLAGSCEVVAFPKTYRADPSVWHDGTLLYIWGRGGGEEKRVVCERAVVLTHENVAGLDRHPEQREGSRADARNRTYVRDSSSPRQSVAPQNDSRAGGQRIIIHLTNSNRSTLETLRTFFTSTSGSLPVYIELEQGGSKRTIETSFKIDPTGALLQALESITGQGAVKVV